MRRAGLLLAVFLRGVSVSTAQDVPLPRTAPPLAPEAAPSVAPGAAPEAASEAGVQQLAGELERAKRKAAYGNWLYTEGVLAKSEAEQQTLLVVRLKRDLEDARWRLAKQEAEAQQKRFENHEIGRDANDQAQAALAAAAANANAALVEWKRAALEAALLNLKRQQRLYTEGVAAKSDVRRAEDAVAALQGQD